MKTKIITTIIVLSLLHIKGYSQQRSSDPKPTTGYYSISNKSEQLKTGSEDFNSKENVQVGKGYYSIRENNKKLEQKTAVKRSKSQPVITKGYYSIGSNSKKL